jgi:hypothetical protein
VPPVDPPEVDHGVPHGKPVRGIRGWKDLGAADWVGAIRRDAEVKLYAATGLKMVVGRGGFMGEIRPLFVTVSPVEP